MKLSFLFLLFLFAVASAVGQSDAIHLIDGKVRLGTITACTDRYVMLESGNVKSTYDKSAVTGFVFSHSDRIITAGGDTLVCKISSNDEHGLIVATPLGVRVLADSTCQSIVYGVGGSIEVSAFPPTNEAYRIGSREHGAEEHFSGTGSIIYIRFGYGIHNGSLQGWTRQWGNLNPPTHGPVFAVETGLIPSPTMSWGIGYEHFQTARTFGSTDVGTGGPVGLDGYVAYDLFFGALRLRTASWDQLPIRLYAGSDVGLIAAKATLTSGGYPQGESGASLALRLRGGVLVSLSAFLHLSLEGRYLSAGEVKALLTEQLAFDGFGAAIGLEYHIPTH